MRGDTHASASNDGNSDSLDLAKGLVCSHFSLGNLLGNHSNREEVKES